MYPPKSPEPESMLGEIKRFDLLEDPRPRPTEKFEPPRSRFIPSKKPTPWRRRA